jgi:hypothetical protein
MTITDCIFRTPYRAVLNNGPVAQNWERNTFDGVANGDVCFWMFSGPGAGSMTMTDCIFTNWTSAMSGTVPTGGWFLDYCALVDTGPDANDPAIDWSAATQSNCITADPQYVSKDWSSADYMDVANIAEYGSASSTGTTLTGGGTDLDPAANYLVVSDIPDVGFAPGGSASIDLDPYVYSAVYDDSEITWSFTGQSVVNVTYDGTSSPQTVTFDASASAVETVTATARDPNYPTYPEDSDDIVVTVSDFIVSGTPDELVIATGECITCLLDLDDWLSVTAYDPTEITWTWTSDGTDIQVAIDDLTGDYGHVHLELGTSGVSAGATVPSAIDETITFTGTDPSPASDSEDLVLHKVENLIEGENFDFEADGAVVSTPPIGYSASAVFFGGTNSTVTFGTSDEAYCGSYAGRVNISGTEGGAFGVTVAGLVSDSTFTYDSSMIGNTIAIGMNVKRSQSQWFRLVFFRFGFGHFQLENLDAVNITAGTDSGWQKYVMYFTLPAPAGDYFWRIDSIATDDQLASADVEMLVDNITIVNYGTETLEDTYETSPPGGPPGIRNRYFELGTDAETTVVGVGTGQATWSSTDMPLGWNIATATDAFQNEAAGYPQYSVLASTGATDSDPTNPEAVQLLQQAVDTSFPGAPAITTICAVDDGSWTTDERGERHIMTFSYASSALADMGLFRAFIARADFSGSSEININSNYGPVNNRFRTFACQVAPQPWWPPSLVVPPGGATDYLIVRFDNISLEIGNVLVTKETTIWIDTAVMNVVQ